MLIEGPKVTQDGAQNHRQSQPEQHPDSQVRDFIIYFSGMKISLSFLKY